MMSYNINMIILNTIRWSARASGLLSSWFCLGMSINYLRDVHITMIMQNMHNLFALSIFPLLLISYIMGYLIGWKYELTGGLIILTGSSLLLNHMGISHLNYWMVIGMILLITGFILALKWKSIAGYLVFGGAQLLIISFYFNISPRSQSMWQYGVLPALLFILSWIFSRDLEKDAACFREYAYWLKKITILVLTTILAFVCGSPLVFD